MAHMGVGADVTVDAGSVAFEELDLRAADDPMLPLSIEESCRSTFKLSEGLRRHIVPFKLRAIVDAEFSRIASS